MTHQPALDRAVIAHPLRWLLLTAMAATIACFACALFDPDQFLRAYYAAWLFYLGISLGSLALVMIQHLTGGAWTLLTRRLAEAQMNTLPLVSVLFLPIALGLPHIFPWVHASTTENDTHESFQNWYLAVRFFCLRAVAYFTVWLFLAWMLSRWSRALDRPADGRAIWRPYKASGPGLVLFAVALHFAAIDWIMSLQPGFTSTMLGPLVFSGQLLSAYTLAVVLFCCLLDRPRFAELLSEKVLNDLGSLLFTLVVLWAYLFWFEFLLIWIADLPRGNLWYSRRSQGGWPVFIGVAVAAHFVIPFFLLLFRSVKQNRRWLRGLATLVFLSQLLVPYYQVMPSYDAWEISRHWMDPLPFAAIGGLWFALLLWLLARRPLLPATDLNYAQARHLNALDAEELTRAEGLAHG